MRSVSERDIIRWVYTGSAKSLNLQVFLLVSGALAGFMFFSYALYTFFYNPQV